MNVSGTLIFASGLLPEAPHWAPTFVPDTKTHSWSQQQPRNASRLMTKGFGEEDEPDHEAELALMSPFTSPFASKVWRSISRKLPIHLPPFEKKRNQGGRRAKAGYEHGRYQPEARGKGHISKTGRGKHQRDTVTLWIWQVFPSNFNPWCDQR